MTRAGLAAAGLRYAPSRPALARLAHIRVVLAVRLSLEQSDALPGQRRLVAAIISDSEPPASPAPAP